MQESLLPILLFILQWEVSCKRGKLLWLTKYVLCNSCGLSSPVSLCQNGVNESDVYNALAPANVQNTNICYGFFRIRLWSVKSKYSERPWGNFTNNYEGGLSSRRRPACLRYCTVTTKLLQCRVGNQSQAEIFRLPFATLFPTPASESLKTSYSMRTTQAFNADSERREYFSWRFQSSISKNYNTRTSI